MAQEPQVSLTLGIATATLVYGIYSMALPNVADVRVAPAQDKDVEASERLATWTSLAVVSGVSLVAKDATIFILGGTMLVTMAWWHRHANHVSPLTKKATGTLSLSDMPPTTQEQQDQVDYGYSDMPVS